MNPIFAGLPVSVFEVMSGLARDHAAVNLGQGFPGDPGRKTSGARPPTLWCPAGTSIRRCSACPNCGRPSPPHYRHWQNLTLDPDREIMITSGATARRSPAR